MPFRTGRHNRRQLVYRGAATVPVESWTLALVLLTPTGDELRAAGFEPDPLRANHLDPGAVVAALNAAEERGLL